MKTINMELNTDYIVEQVNRKRLRKLAIEPRRKYHPIIFEGKTYWCAEDLARETIGSTRAKTIYEMLIVGIIGMVLIIASMYGVAMLIPIN